MNEVMTEGDAAKSDRVNEAEDVAVAVPRRDSAKDIEEKKRVF